MDPRLFLNAFIYLLAAAIAAPLGKRLGLGSVRGYLVIGPLIGPSVFGIIGSEREEVMHFAEFGVVLMLFVIGLELDLGKRWRMRTSVFGLGGLQLALSAAALAPVGGLIDEDWREALALGLILALSSTAMKEFEAIASMAAHQGDEKSYISAARQNLRDLESLMHNAPILKAKQKID